MREIGRDRPSYVKRDNDLSKKATSGFHSIQFSSHKRRISKARTYSSNKVVLRKEDLRSLPISHGKAPKASLLVSFLQPNNYERNETQCHRHDENYGLGLLRNRYKRNDMQISCNKKNVLIIWPSTNITLKQEIWVSTSVHLAIYKTLFVLRPRQNQRKSRIFNFQNSC